MPDQPESSLEARVRELEAQVAELRAARAGPPPSRADRVRRRARGAVGFRFRRDSEHWLNKVGIGLVLFGVAFLFRYSIEQGWLTEWVRVGLGMALAAALLGAGMALYGRQRRFSQVLLGGGIATLYITGFAAYQLYGLVPHAVASAYMLVVTAGAFVLSLRQDDPVLSLVGTIGAFGTPFLLRSPADGVAGLVGYASLLTVGVSALYLYRGWRSVLWTASVGGWAVLVLAHDTGGGAGRGAVQAGVALAWLAFWVLPLLHAVHRPRLAAGDRPSAVGTLLGWDDARLTRVHLHLLSITTPATALLLMNEVWGWPDVVLGRWAIGAAALHAAAAAALARGRPALAHTQASAAAILLAGGTALVLDGGALLVALAAQAALLHLLARRLPGIALTGQAHLMFAALAGWLLWRLLNEPAGDPILVGPSALADLAAIALALLAARALPWRAERSVYRVAAHAALLGWLWRELAPLPAGEGIVTVVWGVIGLALLAWGIRRARPGLQTAGLVTLLLPVAKLFLVDLGALPVPWRILLFLGFGAAFLLLSYVLQTRTR